MTASNNVKASLSESDNTNTITSDETASAHLECTAQRKRRQSLTAAAINHSDVENSTTSPTDSANAAASQLLSESTGDLGIILANESQLITHVNSTFESITGYTRDDSIGRNCNFLQGKHTSPETVERMRNGIKNNQTCQVAVLNYRKNGQPFWNLLTIAPMMNAAGKVNAYIGIQQAQSIIYIDRPLKLFPWTQSGIRQPLTPPEENDYIPRSQSAAVLVTSPLSISSSHSLRTPQTLSKSKSSDSLHKVQPSLSSLRLWSDDSTSQPSTPDDDVYHRPPTEFESATDYSPDEQKEFDSTNVPSAQVAAVNTHRDHFTTLITPPQPTTHSTAAALLNSDPISTQAIPAALTRATPVTFVAETLLPTTKGKYRVRAYKDLSALGRSLDREIVVIIWGAVEGQKRVPLRVHDQCFTSEVLGSLKCDCRQQLDFAMDYIANNQQNVGLIIYLSQEGRGIGLANKIKAYAVQEHGYDTVDANRILGFPDDLREYTSVPSILENLNISSVKLMTNNPRKTEILASLGVNITARIPVVMETNEYSHGYIAAKQARMGHIHHQHDEHQHHEQPQHDDHLSVETKSVHHNK